MTTERPTQATDMARGPAGPRDIALPTPQEWQTMASMAEALVRSGLLPPQIKTPQAALAVMLKGREIGVPSMQALSNIQVITGKPTCNAELMLALMFRDHGDDALYIEETTAERCTVSYRRRTWAERRSYSFTMADAQRAGLAGSVTWQKYPQALLRARCISAVARMAFPDSIGGMFSYEELGVPVQVQDDGSVVLDQTALPSAPMPERPAPAVVRVAPTPHGPPSRGQTTLDRVAGEFAAAPDEPDGQPPGRSVSVEEAKGALKEACLRVGLPAPLTLREVNILAREHDVDVVGSSAGVTPAWLDRIRAALPDLPVGPLDRQHMSQAATALAALRATCGALGRPEPRSLDALNALAGDAGMGILASWDNVSVGWLEAIRRHVGARPGTTEAPAQRHTAEAQSARTEQSLAGWIAAAPDRATLEQLSSDVHRAHEAGAVSQGVAEALLEAVDARTAELDLYGAGAAAAAAGEREAASAELVGAEEGHIATAG